MPSPQAAPTYVDDFADITLGDVARVGGKNASLGELFRVLKPKGVGVLDGFATTAEAYRRLLATGGLEDKLLRSIFTSFDAEDLAQLAQRGEAARKAVLETPLPEERISESHLGRPLRGRWASRAFKELG